MGWLLSCTTPATSMRLFLAYVPRGKCGSGGAKFPTVVGIIPSLVRQPVTSFLILTSICRWKLPQSWMFLISLHRMQKNCNLACNRILNFTDFFFWKPICNGWERNTFAAWSWFRSLTCNSNRPKLYRWGELQVRNILFFDITWLVLKIQ